MSGELHVVLGGSGGAGNAIARALADAGLRVRAVTRSGKADLPATIELRAADVTTAEGVAAAVAGADVVYMAAQPAYHRWPEEFPQMLRSVIDGVAAVGAKLVMVDNLYAYGPGAGVITEATPERATDRKGQTRRTLTGMLWEAHRSGRLRVTIGRASDYFGPRADNSGITALAIEPVAAGKTIRWTGSLDTPRVNAYLPDIARAYVKLGTSSAADGELWILPHGPAVTGREFLAAVNRAVPAPLKTGLVTRGMMRMVAPFHRISRESLPMLYQWIEPFLVDDAKFQKTFGPFAVTPLDEAVRTTVEAYRHHG
jgi:nucleoside-diphosphate-sugar epimerase